MRSKNNKKRWYNAQHKFFTTIQSYTTMELDGDMKQARPFNRSAIHAAKIEKKIIFILH